MTSGAGRGRRSGIPVQSAAAVADPRRPKSGDVEAVGSVAWKWIAAATLLAAALRFFRLGSSPPGLNQDEAINAWNAWCLLRTGHDMTGASWPVFYSHAIGDNRTTLLFYLMMPFQAAFGLSVWTTRLPAAFFGTLGVPLIGFVASRWWGWRAGVVAAVLLAVDPWHLFMSRWGIDGSVTPFFALLPLALLVAARLAPGSIGIPRAGLAFLAGIAAGVATYGYWSMRLWIPAWILVTALLAGPTRWRAWLRGRAPRAWLAFAFGLAITFGPLVWKHLTDPAIARRAAMTRLWEPGASPLEIARLVLGRWLVHFGPKFLWGSGDTFAVLQPAVDGAMHRFMLPLMLAGLVAAIVRFRTRPESRAVLALVIVYPAGDLLAAYDGVHSLRSAAGIGGLVLLATLGAVAAWHGLVARGRTLARAVAIGSAAIALVFVVRSNVAFFGEYNTRREIAFGYSTDLAAAGRWLRPRFDAADAVFCTTNFMNEPWSILLVELGYDPKRWFDGPRERIEKGGWEDYRRVGKIVFMHDPSAEKDAAALEANGRPDHVIFIVRPGQLGLKDPVAVFRNGNEEMLWICEVIL